MHKLKLDFLKPSATHSRSDKQKAWLLLGIGLTLLTSSVIVTKQLHDEHEQLLQIQSSQDAIARNALPGADQKKQDAAIAQAIIAIDAFRPEWLSAVEHAIEETRQTVPESRILLNQLQFDGHTPVTLRIRGEFHGDQVVAALRTSLTRRLPDARVGDIAWRSVEADEGKSSFEIVMNPANGKAGHD